MRGQIIRLQRVLEAEADDSPTAEQHADVVWKARDVCMSRPGETAEPAGKAEEERSAAEQDLAKRRATIEAEIAASSEAA